MKRTSFAGMRCPIARALEVVGEWWTLLVIREAFLGVTRFGELQERLGIARNVLTARLEALVAQGVLRRERYQERPPRDEYLLTPRGRALFPILWALKEWGEACEGVPSPVALVDARTGEPVEPVLVDRRTGREISPDGLRAVPGPGADADARAFLRAQAAGVEREPARPARGGGRGQPGARGLKRRG